ncbi:MAG: M13 family peptidase [Alphaproteobacteria bacterium]|nr:MAG: M13 family peptidase [Alphaproteobacteria bacterium]
MDWKRILLAGVCVGLLAGCGNGDKAPSKEKAQQETAPAGETAASGKPELGSWGVDLSARDLSVKPGDDFFRYANGTWLKTYKLKPDQVRYGSFLVLRDRSEERVRKIIEDLAAKQSAPGSIEQMIGDYFASYMDTATLDRLGIDPLKPDLERIATIRDKADLIRVFGEADVLGTETPIGAGISIDRKNPDRYLLSVGQSGLGLPDRDYYLDKSDRFQKIRDAYAAHIARMLGFAGMDEAAARDAAQRILALETEMAKVHWPRTELRNRDKTYNIRTLDQLTQEFPDFDWKTAFAAAGIDLFKLDKVNVTAPSAIGGLAKIVAATPLATWKDYLTFHLVTGNAGILSEEIDQANFEFYGKVLSGRQQQRDRWKRGVQRVGSLQGLGEAIGQVYVKRYFPPSSKRMMVDLVENLRRAFGERIRNLDWMGPETKNEALAKLAAFHPKIGYPDKWRSYEGLVIRRDDLFGNVRRVRAFFHADEVSRLGKPTDRDEWFMTPQTVNAYYNPSFNEIVFPAAILQPPFFDPNADMAVNYGGIGGVIGHEMGHGFDDQGSKSDAHGIQRNWWTPEDRKRFEERTKALVAQYNQYEPIPGQHVNGQLTLGENIGDLGGVSISLYAYHMALDGRTPPVLDGYDGDQRFFMGWAQVWKSKQRQQMLLRRLKSDPHSPAEFRVNGVVRNVPAWYEAFDVGPDNKLYLPPEQRVQIW